MMRLSAGWRIGLTAVVAALIGAGGALAAQEEQGRGYLQPGSFDVVSVIPAAPRTGDARDQADRAIFKATRALQGTPRWAMATNDVKLGAVDLLKDFSCSLGVSLTPETAPRTVAMLVRAGVDAEHSSSTAKQVFQRKRPFQVDQGPICAPAKGLDFPSGHTTRSWTWAELLAELAPDRAAPILARGRAFGESRIVCGVHNASAVEAGRVTAAATVAAIQGSPQFQADFAAAKAEITRLRADTATPHPDVATCATERALVAQRIY